MDEKYEYWLDIAQYDLSTAEAMYESGRWLYVVFMCQQAMEKLVKGLYVLYIDDNTPRIHDIVAIFSRFADKLKEPAKEEYLNFFKRLSTFYLSDRYPEFHKKLSTMVDEISAKEVLNKAKEVFAWLLTLKPSCL
jgi:HEPN domain-containing protein